MTKILNSKLFATLALILIIVIICVTFTLRTVWWCYFDIFFFFMAAFCQLLAVTLGVKIPPVGGKLSVIAIVCALLGVLSLIGECIALNILF